MSTPVLRFQQFSGEWTKKRLGDLVTFYKGRGLSKEDLSIDGVPCIHYGELYITYGGIIETVFSKTDANFNNPVVGMENDILIPASGETAIDIATASTLKVDGVLIGGDINLLRPIKGICGGFISYQIRGVKKRQLAKYAEGASIVHLYKEGIKSLQVFLPTLEEQQKISSFFSLLDKKIEMQQEKIEQLELFKKGMMQKIFSREIRFKDENGNEYPDWIKVKFGSISKKVGPKNTKGFKYPVYSISNKHGFIPQDEQFEESRLENLDKSSYRIVKKGQFAYNPARINVGSIGLSNFDDPIIVSSLYVCFQLTGSVDNGFVAQYFKTNMFRKEVLRNVEGSVREYLFYENFSNINVWLPTIEEQRKISSYLSLLDLKIEKETTKLNTLLELKKGFLHEMFV